MNPILECVCGDCLFCPNAIHDNPDRCICLAPCIGGDRDCPNCGHRSLLYDDEELVWFCLVCDYVEEVTDPPRWATRMVTVHPNPNYL